MAGEFGVAMLRCELLYPLPLPFSFLLCFSSKVMLACGLICAVDSQTTSTDDKAASSQVASSNTSPAAAMGGSRNLR